LNTHIENWQQGDDDRPPQPAQILMYFIHIDYLLPYFYVNESTQGYIYVCVAFVWGSFIKYTDACNNQAINTRMNECGVEARPSNGGQKEKSEVQSPRDQV